MPMMCTRVSNRSPKGGGFLPETSVTDNQTASLLRSVNHHPRAVMALMYLLAEEGWVARADRKLPFSWLRSQGLAEEVFPGVWRLIPGAARRRAAVYGMIEAMGDD